MPPIAEFVCHPSSVSFLAFDADGWVASLIGTIRDLDLIPHLSVPFLQRQLGGLVEAQGVVYVLVSALRRSSGLRGAYDATQAYMARYLAANRLAAVADMCDFNTRIGYNGKAVSGMLAQGPGVRTKVLDVQQFVAVDMTEPDDEAHTPVWA